MKKDSEAERIGIVIGKMLGGGVESVMMNYYRHIDKSKIQFDFICDEDSTDIPKDEIEKLGGRVILCPPYQHLFSYIKFLKRIFEENRYKIVHANINTLSIFPLFAAKKAHVPVRIAHSHSTSNKLEWKKNCVKNILRLFSKRYSNVFLACTEHAARYQFGDKVVDDGKVTIINNGIDLKSFRFQDEKRKTIRKELGIEDDTFVIGHIGRFMTQKNHSYLIDIFKEIHEKEPNSILLLVGQGPLENEIKGKVSEYNLCDAVIFLGQRNDVNELYQGMDLFLFPSLYEGLGIVLIEAQTAGLPCVASTEVPVVAKVCDNFKFVSLDDDATIWAEACMNLFNNNYDRRESFERVYESNYNIEKEAKCLEKVYMSALQNVNR